jgi:gamma-glutamylaminecyclotransferase
VEVRLFVYGSLKSGRGNNGLLDGCQFVGPGYTEGIYTMVNLGMFPGIVEDGETSIYGEVYDVDDGTLARLDMLEGHPHFYERKDMMVKVNGEWAPAVGYVLPQEWLENSHVVEGGRW